MASLHNQMPPSEYDVDANLIIHLSERHPLLEIRIEVAPGVSIPLIVHARDSPSVLVDSLIRRHQLYITQESKNQWIHTLSLIIQAAIKGRSLH
ncbi:hypothetical protein BDF14DRAFT_1753481 [Spinellus fusiger]|nr:hypothetical protein BDF14DRAFT_1753481 [Spinellus fusiger]